MLLLKFSVKVILNTSVRKLHDKLILIIKGVFWEGGEGGGGLPVSVTYESV